MRIFTTFIALCIVGTISIGIDIQAQDTQPDYGTLVPKIDWGQTGQYIAVGTSGDGLIILDATTRETLVTIPHTETDTIWDVALSLDESAVASAGGSPGVQIWNTATGTLVQSLEGHMRNVINVAWSQDNKLAISWSTKLEGWDVISQQRVQEVQRGGLLASLHWNSENIHLLTPSTSILREGTFHTLQIWNTNTGEIVQEFEGFPDRLTSAHWSPDESKILSTSLNGQVYITDVVTGETRTLMSGDGRILSAAWSPYGGQVAVGIPLDTDIRLEADVFLSSLDTKKGVVIIMPTMTLEQLQTIANRCAISAQPIAQVDWDAVIDNLLVQDDISAALQQLEELPPDARNACIDDFIAVAEALQSR